MADLKQKKQFENLWGQVQQFASNQAPEKKVKVPNNLLGSIFQEVAKEREEEAIKVFKTKVIAIFDTKEALDKALNKGREELAKKEELEYEKLNKELQGLLGMIQQTQKNTQNLMNQAGGQAFAPQGQQSQSTSDEEGEEKGSATEDQQ